MSDGNESDPQSLRDSLSSIAARRAGMQQFIEFEVHGQRYALPIGQVREIVIPKNVTPTPRVAAFVEGVSNLRGEIIPIINLRILFGFDPRPVDESTRTIVVNVDGKTMGCTVDSVTQVLRIENDAIGDAPETITTEGQEYIHGFVKVDDRLVIILDVNEMLAVEHLDQVKHGDRP